MSSDPAESADLPPGFCDAFGTRRTHVDAAGVTLETLGVCRDLASTGRCIPERVRRLATLRLAHVARVVAAEVPADDTFALHVTSEYVAGTRLSEVLAAARCGRLTIAFDAALHLTRQVLGAVASLHDSRGLSHGAITPEHIVLTTRGHAVVTDFVFATALERLGWPRARLWRELRVAVRPQAGVVVLDQAADIGQVGLVALALLAGRPLDVSDYPDRIPAIVDGLRMTRPDGSWAPLPKVLRSWLMQVLPVGTRVRFSAARDAQAALEAAIEQGRLIHVGADHPARRLAEAVEQAAHAVSDGPPREPKDRRRLPEAPFRPGSGDESADVITFDCPRVVPAEALAACAPAVARTASGEILPTTACTPAEEIEAHEAPPDPALTLAQAFAELMALPDPVPAPAAVDVPCLAVVSTIADATTEDACALATPAAEMFARDDDPVAESTSVSDEGTCEPQSVAAEERADGRDVAALVARDSEAPPVKTRVPRSRVAMDMAVRAGAAVTVAASVLLRSVASAAVVVGSTIWRGSSVVVAALHNWGRVTVRAAICVSAWLLVAAGHGLARAWHWARMAARAGRRGGVRAAVAVVHAGAVSIRWLAVGGRRGATTMRVAAAHARVAVVRIVSAIVPALVSLAGAARRTATSRRLRPAVVGCAVAAFAWPWAMGVGGTWPDVVRDLGARLVAAAQTSPRHAPPPTAAAVAEPPAQVGALRVVTQPDGARVFCDGVFKGQAPTTIHGLTPGSHTVMVESPAGTVRVAVDVRGGTLQELAVPIYSGWIAPFAPVELEVRHLDRVLGTTESGRIMVPPGHYDLEFVNSALGIRAERAVDVQPGDIAAVNIDLAPVPLEIAAPAGTEVWIDDVRIGVTPFAPVPVTVGTRQVVARLPGEEPRQRPVIVGYTTPARLTLDPVR